MTTTPHSESVTLAQIIPSWADDIIIMDAFSPNETSIAAQSKIADDTVILSQCLVSHCNETEVGAIEGDIRAEWDTLESLEQIADDIQQFIETYRAELTAPRHHYRIVSIPDPIATTMSTTIKATDIEYLEQITLS